FKGILLEFLQILKISTCAKNIAIRPEYNDASFRIIFCRPEGGLKLRDEIVTQRIALLGSVQCYVCDAVLHRIFDILHVSRFSISAMNAPLCNTECTSNLYNFASSMKRDAKKIELLLSSTIILHCTFSTSSPGSFTAFRPTTSQSTTNPSGII